MPLLMLDTSNSNPLESPEEPDLSMKGLQDTKIFALGVGFVRSVGELAFLAGLSEA